MKLRKLTLTALLTAACYIGFSFFQIKIPTVAGYTSFHLGNVICVLAGLLVGPVCGGIAGAIGMGIGDLLDPVYLITAPKTLILKFIMGFLAGYISHNIFNLKQKQGKELVIYTIITICVTMLVNIILEPTFSYVYYQFLLNNSQKAAGYLSIAKWITTTTNAVLSIICATPLYIALKGLTVE
ncbi:MAG: ECF transporter S component [Erysipelotrichaceae bacterium]